MKSRFTEEQIIRTLEEGRAGMKIEELCRKHGISHATYYAWEDQVRRYDGLRGQENENLGV